MRPPPSGVSGVLDEVLTEDPDRVAVVARDGVLSYLDLDHAANAIAAVLAAHGVRVGDRVAASLPNGTDIVACFHGVMRLGAVWVGVNQALAPPEKNELLADAEPIIVLTDRETRHQIDLDRLGGADRLTVFTVNPDEPDSEWYRLVRSAWGASRPTAPDPFAPAAIAYTSGTTGAPRGVVHSQWNLILPGAALVHSRGYDKTLVKGDFLPLTIPNMMVLTTLLTAQAGGQAVLIDRKDAIGVARWIAKHEITVWNGVPALLYSMVHEQQVRPEQLRSLREVWSGGAGCPETVRLAFEDRFGHKVHMTYGLTEAPSVVAIQPVGSSHVAGASGRGLPHLQVTVRDDRGTVLASGEDGEVCVAASESGPYRGWYRPMLGYWRAAHPCTETVRHGVLHTGDIGHLDAAGNVYIRDRKKAAILRGGANVYPAEVERVLLQVPEVQECVVVPLEDERLGQRVAAVVQMRKAATDDAEALAGHCRHNLARYKVPERFAFVDQFPRNAMGKIQRSALPELFACSTSRPDVSE
jgi:acyl-CoA synthetase (AMP-forming)/AMP-acid ligase II